MPFGTLLIAQVPSRAIWAEPMPISQSDAATNSSMGGQAHPPGCLFDATFRRCSKPVARLARPCRAVRIHRSIYPANGIRRFLTGTPSILAMAALDEGLKCFDGIDPQSLDAKAGALGDLFIATVEQICPEVKLASPRNARDRGAHVCFSHPNGYAVMQALINRGVIGDFRAPDLLRFGLAPLTTRYIDVIDRRRDVARHSRTPDMG